jgi:hypothetical protein
MDLDRTRTTFACGCRRCGHRWLHDYDIVEWTDSDGAPVQWFSDHGISVPSPYQHGVCCPRCGGLRVDAHPARASDTIDVPDEDVTPAEPQDAAAGVAVASGSRLPFGPPFPAF